MRVLGAVMIGVFLAALDQTVVGTALPTDHHRPRRQRPLHLGVHGVPADLDDQRPAVRQAVRPVRSPTDLPVRDRRVHARLAAGRAVAGDVAARRRARRPGPRRRRALPDRPGGHRRPVRAVRARPLPGPVRGRLRPVRAHRPGHRRRSSPTRSAGRSCSSSTCRSARRVLRWSGATCRSTTSPATGREIDYLGAALFTGALVPILVGLTNKRAAEWTDPSSAGSSRSAADPARASSSSSRARPSRSCRSSCSATARSRVSVAAVFLAAFGFFATVVFLPRWFQVVAGSSATVSGYQMLPLLGGLIISAVASGQIVSRTGRYRLLIFGALVVMAVGLFMLSHLEADTPIPVLWAWMFVTGLGVGPTFAVFTARRPEQRAGRAARDGDQQPDVLPAGRRHGRPGHHRDDLRDLAGRGAARGSSPRPASRRRSAGRWPVAAREPRRADRRRRPRRGDPGRDARGGHAPRSSRSSRPSSTRSTPRSRSRRPARSCSGIVAAVVAAGAGAVPARGAGDGFGPGPGPEGWCSQRRSHRVLTRARSPRRSVSATAGRSPPRQGSRPQPRVPRRSIRRGEAFSRGLRPSGRSSFARWQGSGSA